MCSMCIIITIWNILIFLSLNESRGSGKLYFLINPKRDRINYCYRWMFRFFSDFFTEFIADLLWRVFHYCKALTLYGPGFRFASLSLESKSLDAKDHKQLYSWLFVACVVHHCSSVDLPFHADRLFFIVLVSLKCCQSGCFAPNVQRISCNPTQSNRWVL